MLFRIPNRTGMIVLFVGSAILCLVGSVIWTAYSYHLTTTALRAHGKIIQLVERHNNNGDYFYPVFTFESRDGAKHTVYSEVGSYPPSHHVGDSVSILYYPGAPADAHLDDWIYLWGAPILIAVLGGVWSIAGLIALKWPAITNRFRRRELTPVAPQQ